MSCYTKKVEIKKEGKFQQEKGGSDKDRNRSKKKKQTWKKRNKLIEKAFKKDLENNQLS